MLLLLLSSSLLLLSCFCCCCCWQHLCLPPRGVVRFLCCHVLKLEFWHFARPELTLRCAFASVFAVFSNKKVRQPASNTVQKNAKLSISHLFSVFSCVCVCVCVASVFTLFFRLSTFCTCQLSLALSFSSVGGGMTSMRMRLVSSSVSFVALLLKCCRLLCEALVAASCCFTLSKQKLRN